MAEKNEVYVTKINGIVREYDSSTIDLAYIDAKTLGNSVASKFVYVAKNGLELNSIYSILDDGLYPNEGFRHAFASQEEMVSAFSQAKENRISFNEDQDNGTNKNYYIEDYDQRVEEVLDSFKTQGEKTMNDEIFFVGQSHILGIPLRDGEKGQWFEKRIDAYAAAIDGSTVNDGKVYSIKKNEIENFLKDSSKWEKWEDKVTDIEEWTEIKNFLEEKKASFYGGGEEFRIDTILRKHKNLSLSVEKNSQTQGENMSDGITSKLTQEAIQNFKEGDNAWYLHEDKEGFLIEGETGALEFVSFEHAQLLDDINAVPTYDDKNLTKISFGEPIVENLVRNFENEQKLLNTFITEEFYQEDLYERELCVETTEYYDWKSDLTKFKDFIIENAQNGLEREKLAKEWETIQNKYSLPKGSLIEGSSPSLSSILEGIETLTEIGLREDETNFILEEFIEDNPTPEKTDWKIYKDTTTYTEPWYHVYELKNNDRPDTPLNRHVIAEFATRDSAERFIQKVREYTERVSVENKNSQIQGEKTMSDQNKENVEKPVVQAQDAIQEPIKTQEQLDSQLKQKKEFVPKPGGMVYKDNVVKVVNAVANGTAPFMKGTEVDGKIVITPQPVVHSAVSGKSYKGANQILAQVVLAERGRSDNALLTYEHAKKMGTEIRKGSPVVNITMFDKEENKVKVFPVFPASSLVDKTVIKNDPDMQKTMQKLEAAAIKHQEGVKKGTPPILCTDPNPDKFLGSYLAAGVAKTSFVTDAKTIEAFKNQFTTEMNAHIAAGKHSVLFATMNEANKSCVTTLQARAKEMAPTRERSQNMNNENAMSH